VPCETKPLEDSLRETHRYLITRLSLQVFYLWCIVDSATTYIMVVKFRNTSWPPPPQLSLHRRAALLSYSNGTRSVYNRENPKSSLYCDMSMEKPQAMKYSSTVECPPWVSSEWVSPKRTPSPLFYLSKTTLTHMYMFTSYFFSLRHKGYQKSFARKFLHGQYRH
jgi:hypothetical protein